MLIWIRIHPYDRVPVIRISQMKVREGCERRSPKAARCHVEYARRQTLPVAEAAALGVQGPVVYHFLTARETVPFYTVNRVLVCVAERYRSGNKKRIEIYITEHFSEQWQSQRSVLDLHLCNLTLDQSLSFFSQVAVVLVPSTKVQYSRTANLYSLAYFMMRW